MIKKTLNQNAKYAQEFMKTIETDLFLAINQSIDLKSTRLKIKKLQLVKMDC